MLNLFSDEKVFGSKKSDTLIDTPKVEEASVFFSPSMLVLGGGAVHSVYDYNYDMIDFSDESSNAYTNLIMPVDIYENSKITMDIYWFSVDNSTATAGFRVLWEATKVGSIKNLQYCFVDAVSASAGINLLNRTSAEMASTAFNKDWLAGFSIHRHGGTNPYIYFVGCRVRYLRRARVIK